MNITFHLGREHYDTTLAYRTLRQAAGATRRAEPHAFWNAQGGGAAGLSRTLSGLCASARSAGGTPLARGGRRGDPRPVPAGALHGTPPVRAGGNPARERTGGGSDGGASPNGSHHDRRGGVRGAAGGGLTRRRARLTQSRKDAKRKARGHRWGNVDASGGVGAGRRALSG